MLRAPHSQRRLLWLELLLLGSLASVVLIAAQIYRASHANRDTAEGAMRDYAGFAAWSYREHLMSRIREAIDEVLGPVNHGDGLHMGREVPDAQDMGHFLAWDTDCMCHRPRRGPLPLRYLGFALDGDTLGISPNYAPSGTKGWLGDPVMGPKMRSPAPAPATGDAAWIRTVLADAARRTPRPAWGYDLIIVRREGAERILAARSMPTVRGDTMVYGVEYAAATVDSALHEILMTTDLLPPSLVAAGKESGVLDVRVTDDAGNTLFATSDKITWVNDAETSLPVSFGGMRVRAQVVPHRAEGLLIGGTPRSRVPLLVGLLLLAVGLTVLAAVMLRREVRFAAERADFVASVSHELRTPLTQVRLVIDTLRLGRGGDAQSRDAALGVADREVLRLQHLVEGLLRFTRGPRRDNGPRVPADVLEEARAVAREFQPLAAPRDVMIAVHGEGPVFAPLQQGALRQLLLNLLDNAVKYGADRSVVTVAVTPRDGGGARISVTDTGPGVPHADRERIWRPFDRGGAAEKHAAGGSGIGLTIVRQIAEEHGGRAWVEGAPEGGARFVVEIGGAAG